GAFNISSIGAPVALQTRISIIWRFWQSFVLLEKESACRAADRRPGCDESAISRRRRRSPSLRLPADRGSVQRSPDSSSRRRTCRKSKLASPSLRCSPGQYRAVCVELNVKDGG